MMVVVLVLYSWGNNRVVVDGFFGDEAHAEGYTAMARYTELHREILAIPLADLVARREGIISGLITEKSRTPSPSPKPGEGIVSVPRERS